MALNGNQENVWETAEKNNKKKTEYFDFKWPINEFIGKKIDWNALYFKWKKSSEIWDNFIGFLRKSDVYDPETIKKFEEWKENKLFVYLLKEVNKETIPLESLYNWVLKLFEKTYKLENDDEEKLKKLLLEKGRWTLSYLQYWNARRVKFLKENWLNLKTKESSENEDKILSKIFWELEKSLDEKFKNNTDFLKSLVRFSNWNYLVELKDLENILLGLSDIHKVALIQYFVPRISLQDALNYWFLTEIKVKSQIRKKLNNKGLTPKQKKDFIEVCDYSDFFIDTDDKSLKLDKNFDKLIEKSVSEYKESIVLWTWIAFVDFEDLKDRALGTGLVSLESKDVFRELQSWNYIEIKSKKAWEQPKSTFFKITDIDNKSEKITLANVTSPTGWITKNDKTTQIDEVSFEEFFTMLAWISQSNGIKEISFFENSQKLQEQAKVKEEYLLNEEFDNNEISSKADLKKFLDQIDSENSSVELDKMAFRCAPNNRDKKAKYLMDEEVFVVDKVDDSFVYLSGQPPMTFVEFAWAFKSRECRRFPKIKDSQEFLESLKNHPNMSEALGDFELKDGKIYHKKDHDKKSPVEYLVASNWESIMIDELNTFWMDFSTWKYKESKKEWEPNIFDGKSWWKAKNFNYSTMFLYLTSKKFTPIYNKDVIKEEEHEDHHGEHLHKHSSLFKTWMGSFFSIAEMWAWIHHIQHTIEHALKFWNDLKAAKFARWIWKKVLPKWLFYELQGVVEQEEAKHMEAKIKELKWMSTWKMIKEVEHILETSKPYDPELEAALFAVVSKTWVLYPKSLKRFQWTFMWYEALGWKKWDKIYMEFKKECEANPRLPFNEEYLVEKLLDYQTDKLDLRRNKFNKQYGNELKAWKNDEEEDGERKTKNKTTAAWRLEYIFDEFENLTYWNWLWALDNFLDKCPADGHVMGALPFVVLTSWMSMDFLPEMVNKLFWASYTIPVFTSLCLISNKANLELYNEYVSKVIELKHGKKSKIYEEFEEISHGSRQKRINKARKFWEKYWKDLYPAINMNDGFVISKMEEKDNEPLKKYYNAMKEVHDSDDFKTSSKAKEKVDGWFVDYNDGAWTTMAATWAFLKKIKVDTTWNFDTTSKKLLYMHLDHLKEIISNPDIKDENIRKKLFKKYYKEIERHLVAASASQATDYKWKSFYQDLYKYSSFFEIFPWKYLEYQDVNSADSNAYDKMLEEKWEKIKNWTSSIDSVQWEVHHVQESIRDLVEK